MSRYMRKKWSIALIIRTVQVKITMRYYIPAPICQHGYFQTKQKKQKKTSVDKKVEDMEHCTLFDGNTK